MKQKTVLEKYKIDVAITEKELLKVERLIDRAIDKNNPNISVKMENNVKIYSFLGSSENLSICCN